MLAPCLVSFCIASYVYLALGSYMHHICLPYTGYRQAACFLCALCWPCMQSQSGRHGWPAFLQAMAQCWHTLAIADFLFHIEVTTVTARQHPIRVYGRAGLPQPSWHAAEKAPAAQQHKQSGKIMRPMWDRQGGCCLTTCVTCMHIQSSPLQAAQARSIPQPAE